MPRFSVAATAMLLPLLVVAALSSGCGKKSGDPVMLAYLDGATVRVEGEARRPLIAALQDALALSAAQLPERRYDDAGGEKREIDLRTALQKYIEPKDMGTLVKVSHKKYDFYAAIKTPLVQERLRELLERARAGNP